MQTSIGPWIVTVQHMGEKIRLKIQDNKRLKKDWQIRYASLPTS